MISTQVYSIENMVISPKIKMLLEDHQYDGELFGSTLNMKHKDIIDIIKYYSKFPLSKLRKYQSVNQEQLAFAYKEHNDNTIIDLEIRFEILRCVVDYVCFGIEENIPIEEYTLQIEKRISEYK